VNAGQIEQNDIQVNNVTITSMTQERISVAVVSRGTALMNFDLIYSPQHTQKPRTEHWMASVTYYINPAQVSDQAKTNPQYETINPLGVRFSIWISTALSTVSAVRIAIRNFMWTVFGISSPRNRLSRCSTRSPRMLDCWLVR
jgi:hypothetical protein